MEIEFINGKSNCGCELTFRDGHGEYSDVHKVKLCYLHSGAELIRKVIDTGEMSKLQHEDLEAQLCERASKAVNDGM